MYQVGNTVIYKNDGVCKITEIIIRTFREKEIEYYVLNPVHNQNAEILVPKNNPDLVEKMRKVLTKEEIIQIIEAMPDEEEIWILNETDRKEKYREILNSGDRTELVRLIKTLYVHKQNQKQCGRKLHLADEKILRDAEKMLFDEFAYVLEIAPEEVLEYIKARLDN
ncbi:MAG: CarD family transcriptional regulator [Acutalibacteraceae bacterium]|nr:CarD family transcriptional regulator [Acutalibacteraceae bacterium]